MYAGGFFLALCLVLSDVAGALEGGGEAEVAVEGDGPLCEYLQSLPN